MGYTRRYIEKIQGSPKTAKPVLEELLNKLHSGKPLTLAEEDYACSITRILRNSSGQYQYDVTKIQGCTNYRFRRTYPLFANDLEGKGPIYDYFGLLSTQKKELEVRFLDELYKDWDSKIKGKKTGDRLKDYLIDEALHQIKMMEKYCSAKNILDVEKRLKYKAIILHSRYIYLLVKSFYEDLGKDEIVVRLHDHHVLIDQFCFVHTMFRHFAADVKDYQEGKSYHIDQRVFYKDLPEFLSRFVQSFGRNCSRKEFDGRSIKLLFNGRKYSIWFRPYTPPGSSLKYLRLQTFYPIDRIVDLRRTQGLNKIKINRKLTFLVKHLY